MVVEIFKFMCDWIVKSQAVKHMLIVRQSQWELPRIELNWSGVNAMSFVRLYTPGEETHPGRPSIIESSE